MSQTPVTTTHGTGVASSKFDCVEFHLAIQKTAKTGPEASSLLAPIVANVKRLIHGLETAGVTKYSERPSIDQPKAWDPKKKQYVLGEFVASHAISFQIGAVDKAAEVYAALTEIEDVKVDQPEPKIEHEHLTRLQSEALADAMKRVVDRAKVERDIVFGEKAKEIGFSIVSFQPRYDDSLSAGRTPRPKAAPARAMMAMESVGGGGDDDGLSLDFGEAEVTCTLSVTWETCIISNSRI